MRDAVIIILRDADRLLAIRRAAGVRRPHYWCPPGGAIEPGETAHDAVVRESREEVGLAVRPVRHVWTTTSDDGEWSLQFWLAERIDDTAPAPDPREVAEARWVDASEFLALEPIFDAHRPFFREVWPTL
jgi:8-oxo-dGTP diphosphatase